MMIETMKRTMRRALIAGLALASLPGAVKAQEGEEAPQDIQNVLLTFHLVQADGFTDDDPEISDVVTELRRIFNFQGYRLLSTSLFNVGMQMSNYDNDPLRGSGSQRVVVENSDMVLMVDARLRAAQRSSMIRGTVKLTDITDFNSRGWGDYDDLPPLLEISVNMRDGQRVVLGSAPRTADEPVLILVVTARINPGF
jgi:hypothetical protein